MTNKLQAWRFTINVAPMIYRDHIIVWKPKPHTEADPRMTGYYHDIAEEIAALVESPFTCPVELEMDFYMKEKRVAYPTSAAHVTAKSLVPNLIADPRLLSSVTSRAHYNWDDDKNWQPRIELTVIPIVD